MKVLAPLTTQPPSTFSARVRIAATSEPVSGSVIASAAIFSPRIAGASQRSCCAEVPNVASGAPDVGDFLRSRQGQRLQRKVLRGVFGMLRKRL